MGKHTTLNPLMISALNLYIVIKDNLELVPEGITMTVEGIDYDLKETLECFIDEVNPIKRQ